MEPLTVSLPRGLEASGQAPQILQTLRASCRPLWPDSDEPVPVVPLSGALRRSLLTARRCGQLLRGFEAAAETLARERQGLDRLAGQSHGQRISRIMLLSSDGSERFYREAELLIERHRPRLLACLLEADSRELGGLLFGRDASAKCILITHKNAVAHMLLSLVPQRHAGPVAG
jgi:hypothetical protein